MYLGKIVEIGTKQEIFSTPTHPYTRALLSAIPVPDPERKRKAMELKGEVPSAINMPTGCRFHPRCPFAEKKCSTEGAELLPVTSTHSVACHRK
jgi:oligopeptide/dipeptide ABC transporter ATP-binding protein